MDNSTVQGSYGGSYSSVHLFDCFSHSSTSNCSYCEQDVLSLLGNAGPDMRWMPAKMRANAEKLLIQLKTLF